MKATQTAGRVENVRKQHGLALFVGGLVLIFTCLLAGCDFGETTPTTCVVDGITYSAGDSFPSADNCNTCSCDDDGQVSCTALACPAQCEYNGNVYFEGEVFDAGDGCNTCSCTAQGVGQCTEMACPEEQCPVAKVSDPDETCVAMTVHAKSPNTGKCCFYSNPCEAPEGWDTFGSLEACQEDECVQISCPPGMKQKDLDGDGCDDVCVNPCTDVECGPQPLLPNYECSDGETIAGPSGECTLDENQICGWVIIECPAECEPGDQKDADDGCNTCSCTESGQWICTEMACQCNPETEWDRQYMSTDPEDCALLDYACPQYTTDFLNACGCGCKQDPSCPEWFNCMPSPDGDACDEEKIKQCPYSDIAY